MAKGNFIEAEGLVKKLNEAFTDHVKVVQMSVQTVKSLNDEYKKLPSDYAKGLKDVTETYNKSAVAVEKLKQNTQKLVEAKAKLAPKTSEEIVNGRALAQNADRQTRATSALVGAYANLSAKHAMAKKTLQDLIASQTASSSAIRKAQREFQALDKRVMAADRSVRVFNRNVGNYPQLNKLTGGLTSLMAAFGLVGGVYLFASVIKDAFKVTKEFDKATADLAATMGKSRSEISALTNSAKQFGATTIFTATEVTKLQKELGKLGFSEREILASTKGILSLASAVDTDLANAAEVGGSTLRAFNLDASEMGRVVDVMAKGFTSSALDISNFRESIKYVAPVAASSNVTLEQTTALLGVLADNGIKGSMAGTSLRRIMTDIVRTGKPFNEGLREIVKNGISVKDAFDEVGRTAQTSLVVLGNNIEKIDALTVSLDNAAGSAQKMADEQLNSLEGKIKLLTSAWDGFILSLNNGDSVISRTLGGLIDYLTETIKLWEKVLASPIEKAKIVGQEYRDRDVLQAENDLLNKKNTILKEIETNQNRINILSRQPQTAETIKELKDFQSKNLALQTQIKQEGELIKIRAQSAKDNYYGKALALQQEGLAIEKNMLDLKKVINAKDLEVATRQERNAQFLEKKKASEEYEKQRDALIQVNEKIKTYNALMAKMDEFIGTKRKPLKQLTEDFAGEDGKEMERLRKLREKASEDELKRLFQLQKKKLESEKRYFNQLSKDEGMYYHEREEFITESLLKEIEIAELNREEGLRLAKGNRTEEKIVWEEFYKEYESIVVDAEERILKIRNDKFNEWTQNVEKYEGEGLKLNLFGDDPASEFEKWREKGTETLEWSTQDWMNYSSELISLSQQLANTLMDIENQRYQNRLNNLENEKNKALEFAGESATARAEIERQYEERRVQIQRRQAQAQKRQGIFNAVIGTAQGIMQTIAQNGFPAAIPFIALISAIGAAQVAMISSQQIPEFYKGTDNAPEGMAWTQERGAEIITDKSGKVKTLGSNKGAQLTHLNKGDKVFTAQESKSIMFNKELNAILSNNGIANASTIVNNSLDLSPLRSDIKSLENVIKNKSELQMISDRQGERVYKKEQGKRALIVSNRLRIKS
jgi:hypothetical protein